MKIGFDAKRATHNLRGLGNYSRNLLNGLGFYNPEIELNLFTPPFNDKRILKWLDLNSTAFKIHTPDGRLGQLWPSFWRSFLLSSEIEKYDLDIYHGLSHELPFFIKSAKVKKIVTIHDLIFIRYPEFFPWIDRLVYFEKFSRACKNADLIIAICEQTKRDIVEFLKINPEKIRVHYQSVDPHFCKEFSIDEIQSVQKKFGIHQKYILNVGAFEARKNQINLIKGYAKIESKIEEVLVLIGNGKKYLNECQELIKNLKLENRIIILNKVPFEDLPLLYQGASVFVFPSLFEGFGIPIVEALFSKIPVITSKGSCFPESAGPNSVYINPLSLEEIANAIVQVLSSEELKKSMVSNGLNYAEKFKLEHSTQALVKIYKESLGN